MAWKVTNVVETNFYGTIQRTSYGYRIVRGGDGLVIYRHKKYEKVKELFDSLHKNRVKSFNFMAVMKHCKRIDDAYDYWLEKLGRKRKITFAEHIRT